MGNLSARKKSSQARFHPKTSDHHGFRLAPDHHGFRLTPSVLRTVVGGVIFLHLLLYVKMKSRLMSSENSPVDLSTPRRNGITTVPFIVSLTKCGDESYMEGAAVLKYSIHQASIHGNMGGKYDYKMFAVYHPDASDCARELEDLGFKVFERQTPVKVEDIRGEVLRQKIENNGCCGSKELIKLEAYTFTDFPIVVHVDLDVLILKPLDILFDAMLEQSGDLTKYKDSLDVMWPGRPLPHKVNAFFTRDFGMIKYHRKYKPVQGGFLVLRPDNKVYKELVEIVKTGDFDERGGWGNKIGLFYGSMTIQGKFSQWIRCVAVTKCNRILCSVVLRLLPQVCCLITTITSILISRLISIGVSITRCQISPVTTTKKIHQSLASVEREKKIARTAGFGLWLISKLFTLPIA